MTAISPLINSEDAALLAQLQQGDSVVLGEIYDRHWRPAYRVLLRIVGHAQTAEDLLQEVFVRLWTRASLFDPERGDLRGWILIIARHYALDYLRSSFCQKQRNTVDLGQGLYAVPKSGRLASSVVEHLSLEAALAQLTENQRLMLHLAYSEGMSQSEIAEALGLPLGTIKTWTRKALALMREQLR